MSLYKSVLDTFYKDLLTIENTMIGNIFHGTTDDLKTLGNAARVQWTRIMLAAISEWCNRNPNAISAPETFLPGSNPEIDEILNPGVKELNEASDSAADESSSTSDSVEA